MGRIVVDPKVRFGKPCIRGTRITVQEVLELVNEGIPFGKIIEEYYPELTEEDIKACRDIKELGIGFVLGRA